MQCLIKYDLCMLVIMQSVMYCEVTWIFFVYIVSCQQFFFLCHLKGKNLLPSINEGEFIQQLGSGWQIIKFLSKMLLRIWAVSSLVIQTIFTWFELSSMLNSVQKYTNYLERKKSSTLLRNWKGVRVPQVGQMAAQGVAL